MRDRRSLWLGILWFVLALITLVYELQRRPQLVVQWSTETEVDTAGFNLYRAISPEGPFERVNEQLIVSNGNSFTGADYELVDAGVERGQTYYYQLEDIETDGRANRTELAIATADDVQAWIVGLAAAGLLAGVILAISGLRPVKEQEGIRHGASTSPQAGD